MASNINGQHLFQQQSSIIQKRWPQLVKLLSQVDVDYTRIERLDGTCSTLIFDGIQINSSYDSAAEAEMIVSQLLSDSADVVLYGVGNGLVIEKLIMQRQLRQIHVRLLNLMLFKVVLEVFDCRSWLTSPDVTLELAEQYQYVQRPFLAIPAELVVADESAAIIRDRVCLELDSQYIESKKGLKNKDIEDRVNKNLTLMKTDNDILELAPDTSKVFAVIAAGPSLSLFISWLAESKNREKLFIIAVDAAIKPLYQAGIKPDLIVSIDPIGGDLFYEIPADYLKDLSLLYFPMLDKGFLAQWPGKRYASYSTGSTYDQLSAKVNKTRLYSGGSVIHPSIDAAVQLGAKEVLLFGADFSFINDQQHVAGAQQFSHIKILAAKECKHWVLNGYGEKNPTYLNFRGYLRDLEHYIALHPNVNFYNSSKLGAKISGTSIWQEFEQ